MKYHASDEQLHKWANAGGVVNVTDTVWGDRSRLSARLIELADMRYRTTMRHEEDNRKIRALMKINTEQRSAIFGLMGSLEEQQTEIEQLSKDRYALQVKQKSDTAPCLLCFGEGFYQTGKGFDFCYECNGGVRPATNDGSGNQWADADDCDTAGRDPELDAGGLSL